MSHKFEHQVLHAVGHALGHAIKHEKQHGRPKRANGLALVFWGFLLLPIPFVGIPMIIFGIINCFAD